MMQDHMFSIFSIPIFQSKNQRKDVSSDWLIFSIGSNGWLSNSNSPKRDPASPNLRMVSWKQCLNTPQEIIRPDVQWLEIVGSCNSFTVIHPFGSEKFPTWSSILTSLEWWLQAATLYELGQRLWPLCRSFTSPLLHVCEFWTQKTWITVGFFSKKNCPWKLDGRQHNDRSDVCFVGCFAKIPRQIQNDVKVGNFDVPWQVWSSKEHV